MKKIVLGLCALGLFSSCAAIRSPAPGSWYTDVTYGIGATAAQKGDKMGKACASSILGIIATGDASIDAARKAGGISSIYAVDANAWSILGLYGTYCTIVRGN